MVFTTTCWYPKIFSFILILSSKLVSSVIVAMESSGFFGVLTNYANVLWHEVSVITVSNNPLSVG